MILTIQEPTHIHTIDTGVLETHQEFSGRMGDGFSAQKRTPQPPTVMGTELT